MLYEVGFINGHTMRFSVARVEADNSQAAIDKVCDDNGSAFEHQIAFCNPVEETAGADILKVARLVEEISDKSARRYKDYIIQQAESDGVITTGDAIKLRTEYCAPDRCDDPWDYRYTIVYWGKLFEGDIPNDYNETGCSDLAPHWSWIRSYGENMEITVWDNEYDVKYSTINGEWV